MTKPNFAYIVTVLDRSGSMSTLVQDVCGGYNTFIKEQRAEPGEAIASLVQFDSDYQVDYRGTPLQDVPDLTPETYVPRGSTALLDALGRTITEVGAELARMAEKDRPSKVIFVIYTDGQENASHEFKRERIAEMITRQREKYSWDFVFLAANQDAIASGVGMGISPATSYNFAPSAAGVRFAASSASSTTSAARSSSRTVNP